VLCFRRLSCMCRSLTRYGQESSPACVACIHAACVRDVREEEE
jgi:hypothetical protein